MNQQELINLNERQKEFFLSGKTLDVRFRINVLKKIRELIISYESQIFDTLQEDLGKPCFESYASETGMILQELNLIIRNLHKWSCNKRVYTPLVHFIARSYYRFEPYGRVLIISPWNYPFQLLFNPLIGAVAAGNCVIAKPSRSAVHTSEFLIKMINDRFNPEHIHLIRGGHDVNQWILKEKYDYIFFTGSSEVGKQVMKSAAENLTPLSLELGGKCPVIVAKDANIRLAAKRILWGKMLNAGQSCVAPDYVLAHTDIKDDLVSEMKSYLIKTYGSYPDRSADFCRIINPQNVKRIQSYLTNGNIIHGGMIDTEKRYVSPTLTENTSPDDLIMKEEIFGPLLPVMSFNQLDEAIECITNLSRPLAIYLFTRSASVRKKVMTQTQSGAACINDTVVYFINPHLPFGGVGKSGMGRYHGRFSFETFSYKRSFMHKSNLIDFPVRYPPYKNKINLLRLLVR